MPNDIVIIPGSKTITFQDGSNTVQRLSITGSGLKFTGAITSSKLSVSNNLIIDGNLGIGTSSPTINGGGLQIYGAGQKGLRISGNSSNSYSVEIGCDTTKMAFIQTVGSLDRGLNFFTGNASTITMTLTGSRVGIGNTSPVTKLDVVGSDASFPATSGTTQNTGSILRLRNGNSNLVLDIGGNGGNGNWLQSTNRTDLSLNYPLLLNPNGGNVGIGTTGVSANLVIGYNGTVHYDETGATNVIIKGKTSNGRGLLEIHDAAGTVKSYFQSVYGTGAYLGTLSNHSLLLTTGGTERARLDTNGNLGIGSTSPGAKLDVNAGTLSSTANSTLTIATFNSSLGNASYLKILEKRNSVGGGDWTTATTRIQKTIDSTDQAYIDFNPTGSAYGIAFGTGATTPTQKMVIDINGNVGIGTSGPTSKLHIYGGDLLLKNTNTSFSIVSNYAGAGDIPAGTFISSNTATLKNLAILPSSDGAVSKVAGVAYNGTSWRSMYEYSNVTSGEPNLLLVKTAGNVGIGTTSPGYKLDVSGSIRAAGGSNSTFISAVTSGTDRYFLDCYGTSNRQIFALYENSSNAYLNSWSNMIFRANQNGGSGGYFVFSGANVGIGTTSPRSGLHVNTINGSSANEYQGLVVSATISSSRGVNIAYDATNDVGVIQPVHNGVAWKNLVLNPSGASVSVGSAAAYQKLSVQGAIEAGVNTATTGGPAYYIRYNGVSSDYINSIGSEYSSGAMILGYGVTGKSNAAGFVSTFDNFTGHRSALIVGNGLLEFKNSRASLNTAVDSTVPMTSSFLINTSGDVGIGVASNLSKVGIGTSAPSTLGLLRTGIVAVAGNVGPSINFYLSQTATTSLTGDANLARITVNPIDNWGGHILFLTKTADGNNVTAPSEKMRLDANGNLGIGTSSPSAKLHVVGSSILNGTTYNYGEFNVVSSNSYNTHFNIGDTGTNYITTANNGITYFRGSTNGIYGMFVSGSGYIQTNYTTNLATISGNVGIGTSTLFAKFVVSNGSGENIEFNSGNVTYNGGILEYINRNSATTRPDFNFFLNSAGGGAFKFYTGGANERLRITATGNVGIGTSSPGYLLDVNGSARIIGNAITGDSTADTGISITHGSGADQYGRIRFYALASNIHTIHSFPTAWQGSSFLNSSAGALNLTGTNGITFGSWNNIDVAFASAGNNYFKGNVGIGTTSPTAKLHVSGSKTSTLLRLQSPTATNALFVSGSGCVGIGTSSPTNALEVSYTITSNTAGAIAQFGAAGSGGWANSAHQVVIGGPSLLGYTGLIIYSDTTSGAGQLSFADGRGANDSWRGFISYDHSTDALFFGTNTTEKIRITSAGNVGIGTTTVRRTLDVSGSFRATGLTSSVAIATQMDKDVPTVDALGTFRRRTYITASAKTTNWQLTNTEEGYYLRSTSATNISCSIRTNATHPIPTNAVYTIFQVGAGTVTVTGSGVVINGTRTTAGQYKAIQIIKVGTNTYDIIGGG